MWKGAVQEARGARGVVAPHQMPGEPLHRRVGVRGVVDRVATALAGRGPRPRGSPLRLLSACAAPVPKTIAGRDAAESPPRRRSCMSGPMDPFPPVAGRTNTPERPTAARISSGVHTCPIRPANSRSAIETARPKRSRTARRADARMSWCWTGEECPSSCRMLRRKHHQGIRRWDGKGGKGTSAGGTSWLTSVPFRGSTGGTS